MMDDGEIRLQEFLRAEEKRGHLCNLTDASGPPNQSPSDWCQLCALAAPTASGAGNATLI